MLIRSWSFTKLWVVNTFFWTLAWIGLVSKAQGFGIVLALIPVFITGAWAGQHPEIERWPRIRIASLWGAALGAGVLTTKGLIAIAFAAPVAVLTVRWFELRGEAPLFSRRHTPLPIERVRPPDDIPPFPKLIK